MAVCAALTQVRGHLAGGEVGEASSWVRGCPGHCPGQADFDLGMEEVLRRHISGTEVSMGLAPPRATC